MWHRQSAKIVVSVAILLLIPVVVGMGLRGTAKERVPATLKGGETALADVVSERSLLVIPDETTPTPIFSIPPSPTREPTPTGAQPSSTPPRASSPTPLPTLDPAALGLPIGNRISNPPPGAIVSGELKIKGVAAGSDFARWRLDLLLNGNEQLVVFLDDSENPREEEGTFERIDTALFPDGTHVLRLRVFHKDGTFEEYRRPVTFANGNTSFVLRGGYVLEGQASESGAEATPEAQPGEETPTPAQPAVVGNGITEPVDGARVSGVIRVKGRADAPNFARWQLELLLYGDEAQRVLLAEGEKPRSKEGTFKKIDTTVFPDGTHVLRLRVVYTDANYEEYRVRIVVDNRELLASVPNQNGITSPSDGAVLQGVVKVEGVAFDPNFKKWQLDLLLYGDPNQAIFLDRSSRPRRIPEVLTTVDTTQYPDGTHALRLRVVRTDGNYDEYTVRVIFQNGGSQQ